MLSQFAAGPVPGAVARFPAGGVEDPGAQPGSEFRGRLAGTMRFEPVEASAKEPFLPLPDRGRGGVELVDYGLVGEPLSQQQQNLGPLHESCRQRL